MLSIGYIVNALAAWWLFGENVTLMRMAGMLVIVTGVWLVAKS
jgi:multidrug transporter EmrE-like cation transporter